MTISSDSCREVSGTFISLAGERYYAIRDVDQLPPFFVNLVGDSDHWMFIASNGALTAGRWGESGDMSVTRGGLVLSASPSGHTRT